MSVEGQATGGVAPATEPSGTEGHRPPAGRFVWWSTNKSVADGVPSVLAALEVVFAVAAYWAIAIYFETTTHLWVSICVAPLLLLRSEQSIAVGVRWYEFYLQRADELGKLDVRSLLQSVEVWGSIATGLIASTLVSYLLAYELLVGHEGWPLYWRTAMVGYIALVVAGAGAGAVIPSLTTELVVKLDRSALILFVALTTILLAFPLAFVLGIWLRTVVIRFVATLRFLPSGFWEIPINFRRILFVVDMHHPAELLPGYSGDVPNTGTAILRDFETAELPSKLFSMAAYLVFLIPAYLYRLSIKSTCWLYLPLVYIASERDFAWTSEHLVDRLVRGGWE